MNDKVSVIFEQSWNKFGLVLFDVLIFDDVICLKWV